MSRSAMRIGRVGARGAVIVLTAMFWAGCAAGQPLATKIELTIAQTNLGRASVAAVVLDLESGRELAAYSPDLPMIPASNQKLLTTAAVLSVLGPEASLTTELLAAGDDLIVRGTGDPGFGDPELLKDVTLDADGKPINGMDVNQLVDRWVEAVKKRGMTRVGTLWIDDRAFEQERVHPNWPVNQLHRWYCAQVAGINFNDNCIDVYATPKRPGEPPAITIVPSGSPVGIDNRAVSIGTGEGSFGAARHIGTNNMVFTGKLGYALKEPVNVTVDDPPMFFARTLRNRLEANGVVVDHIERVGRDDEGPAGAEPVAIVRSPLTTLLRRCNEDSQNLFAEALFKHLGHRMTGEPGSWQNGAAAVRVFLTDTLGPEAASVTIDDGSGMSRENRVSPRTITRLLAHMDGRGKLGEVYRESLARPGTGTLRDRFVVRRGGRVARNAEGESLSTLRGRLHAKSGYISEVITLSGYLTSADGERVAFSVMLNGWDRGTWEARELIDKIVRAIDEHIAAPATAEGVLGG